jgi:hypothetical protein
VFFAVKKSQIMLENKIIQLEKAKTFVQQYKILHISFSAEETALIYELWYVQRYSDMVYTVLSKIITK